MWDDWNDNTLNSFQGGYYPPYQRCGLGGGFCSQPIINPRISLSVCRRPPYFTGGNFGGCNRFSVCNGLSARLGFYDY